MKKMNREIIQKKFIYRVTFYQGFGINAGEEMMDYLTTAKSVAFKWIGQGTRAENRKAKIERFEVIMARKEYPTNTVWLTDKDLPF